MLTWQQHPVASRAQTVSLPQRPAAEAARSSRQASATPSLPPTQACAVSTIHDSEREGNEEPSTGERASLAAPLVDNVDRLGTNDIHVCCPAVRTNRCCERTVRSAMLSDHAIFSLAISAAQQQRTVNNGVGRRHQMQNRLLVDCMQLHLLQFASIAVSRPDEPEMHAAYPAAIEVDAPRTLHDTSCQQHEAACVTLTDARTEGPSM